MPCMFLTFWEVIIKGMIWFMRKLLIYFVTYVCIICYPSENSEINYEQKKTWQYTCWN
jgi:hypothetical protein